jgi:hypothetical protein
VRFGACQGDHTSQEVHMQFKVTAPAEGFTGHKLAVAFKDGVAVVEESAKVALEYFRRKGYTVEPVDAEPSEPQHAAAEPVDESDSDTADPQPVDVSDSDTREPARTRTRSRK